MLNTPPGKTTPGEGLQKAMPGANTALTVLLLLALLNYMDRQILSAVVPYIKTEFLAPGTDHGWFVNKLLSILGSLLGSANPENAATGLLGMAIIVSYMIMAPIFAALKMRRWVIIAVGAALWSLATGACGMVTVFGTLLLARAAVGVGEAAYGPIAPAMLADFYPANRRGTILSWFYASVPVGSALGFVVGGLVADHFGWRWAFYLAVPPGLLLAAVCMFLKEPAIGQADEGHKEEPAEAHPSTWETYKTLFRNPSFMLCTLGMTASCFALGGIAFWMPDYIHTYRGVTNLGMVNTIFGAILVISGITASLFGGRLADYLREKVKGSYFVVSGVFMLIGFPCSIAMLYVPFPYAWIFLFVAAFCLFVNTGPTNTILVNVVKPRMRPGAQALNILIIHALGDVISPLVIGSVADATGSMNTAFALVSLSILVSGVLWIAGRWFLDRDTARVLEKA